MFYTPTARTDLQVRVTVNPEARNARDYHYPILGFGDTGQPVVLELTRGAVDIDTVANDIIKDPCEWVIEVAPEPGS